MVMNLGFQDGAKKNETSILKAKTMQNHPKIQIQFKLKCVCWYENEIQKLNKQQTLYYILLNAILA